MQKLWHWKYDDPLGRAYRRYLLLAKNLSAVCVALLLAAWLAGVPHLQTTYRFVGPMPKDRIPRTDRKIDAWYISVTGWQHVRSGQYGQDGCPYIMFIPLGDCLGVDWL